MKLLIAILLVAAAALLIGAVLVYEGLIEIAADVPHSAIVYKVLETARDRAIAVRAKDINVPPLDDPQRIAKGATDYADMCTSCHLTPGDKESELRKGLYPQPPDLTVRVQASAGEMFWVIKHGIKMSAMPAWGLTHDDERIWDLVAFIRKLPELTPAQYQTLAGTNDQDAFGDRNDQGTHSAAEGARRHRHDHDHAAHKPH